MPTREQAIKLLEEHGHPAAAEHVRTWRNSHGGTGGWDANLKRAFPPVRTLIWPHSAGSATVASIAVASPAAPPPITNSEQVLLPAGAVPAFDAYWMIDWSSSSRPVTGADSIWSALVRWDNGAARIETQNHSTRDELAREVTRRLSAELRDQRVLIGFDFPLGYPRGFSLAWGHSGGAVDAWDATWSRLEREVRDDGDNANNRFGVAAALNADISGSFGPFYGRPDLKDATITRTLSAKHKGVFAYPLKTIRGPQLARMRETDLRGGTASTPWFLWGGGNSVGGQAIVGIPRARRIRAQHPDVRVWPFETGPKLPGKSDARVVVAEIYPSLFHTREKIPTDVHDRLQVLATALALARKDANAALGALFLAPTADRAVLKEEGWILGVT